jgi:hypothetical protein
MAMQMRLTIAALVLIVLVRVPSVSALEDREFEWAWTGKELAVIGSESNHRFDPGDETWKPLLGFPYQISNEKGQRWRLHERLKLHALSPDEVAVACLPGKSEFQIGVLDLSKGTWKEIGSVGMEAMGTRKWLAEDVKAYGYCLSNEPTRIRAIFRAPSGFILLMAPQPDLTFRKTIANETIIVPGFPTVNAPGAYYKGNWTRIPGGDETSFFWDGTVFTWGSSFKQNPGYLWHANPDSWELLAEVPLADERDCMGGPVPRNGCSCCFSGSRVFVFGGCLSWSSAIGEDHPGFCWSKQDRRWRLLPQEGAPDFSYSPGVCWTGTEAFVFGISRQNRDAASGGLFDPAVWRWRTVSSENCPIYEHRPICFWGGKEVFYFKGNLREGAAFDPTSNRWRHVSGLPLQNKRGAD